MMKRFDNPTCNVSNWIAFFKIGTAERLISGGFIVYRYGFQLYFCVGIFSIQEIL